MNTPTHDSSIPPKHSVDIWIGSKYRESIERVLILGESTYGNDPCLKDYVPMWIRRESKDQTFSRIFNAFSSTHTDHATETEREGFWQKILFYNFVQERLSNREDRPSVEQYRNAMPLLHVVLKEYLPKRVFILGLEQAKYSLQVVNQLGIPSVSTGHPTSRGLKTVDLSDAWNELLAK